MTDWSSIAQQIAKTTGEPFSPQRPRRVGGGCINSAIALEDGRSRWFVKLNRVELLDMFEAELAGLEEMRRTASIRVPRPLCTGCAGAESFIVMEHIQFGSAKPGAYAAAGHQLAAMHRTTADAFGWHRDNTIGSTPQANGWDTNWILFWREHRLGFQLGLAARRGFGGRLQRLGEKLLEALPALIDHAPTPSLIHGDLWGGNLGFDAAGNPVIFDPATYYADREAEIAMTELFGGFGADFYSAYQEAWPLPSGYPTRKLLYNLYHVLNHLNLFGEGYSVQAQGLMERLLAEV